MTCGEFELVSFDIEPLHLDSIILDKTYIYDYNVHNYKYANNNVCVKRL